MTGAVRAEAALSRALAKSAQRGRSAESLTDHLAATLTAAGELAARVGRITVVEGAVGRSFWPAVRWAAVSHDAGKVADGFQKMITGRAPTWGQRHEVLSLGFLPLLIDDEALRRWVAFGVLTHHRALVPSADGTGKLSIGQLYGHGGLPLADFRARIGAVDPAIVAELHRWLAATAATAGLPVAAGPSAAAGPQLPDLDVVAAAHTLLDETLRYWEEQGWAGVDHDLTAILLQGAVTLADHLSSAHGTLHGDQPIGPALAARLVGEFTAAGRQLHRHQRQAGDVSGHLLLRAPTGTGKTEASLLWAAAQVADLAPAVGGVPRVFYTLPYLASINAMARRLGALLGDDDLIGVSHSRAASYHLAAAICAEDEPADGIRDDDERRVAAARKAVSRAAATRLFRETVRVSTPYQLLRGALAGPVHAGIVLDSANSVFILDELHAYEPVRLGYIVASAQLWERLGGRVAVLSATLPTALAELFGAAMRAPVHRVSAEPGCVPQRHRIGVRNRALTSPDAVDEMRDRLAAGEAVLVVANNVAQAQQLYDELSSDARRRHEGDGGADAAILLHSRFRRGDRSRIERRIINRYGTRAAAAVGRRRGGLVVATQVVEVSLDVDFDVLFTSAAPLEALLQRFGRVNRLGARPPADVIVHPAAYGPRRGDRSGRDYADGVYPREPVEAGWRILCGHDGQPVDEVQAGGWLDEVYATAWGQAWRADVERERRRFHDEFLSFAEPYADRSPLADRFDELFDGTEAVLQEDLGDYESALQLADHKAAGRLLADDFLIPMPAYAARLARLDRKLGVRIVDGEYDDEYGLTKVNAVEGERYRLGEVF
ncbi:CRISPR-associated helicase Cas3' [Solwaraspora sp. WMMB762]|uniref:CRISPR-associated helicase Cas3' n=1 Tax=Solwaraspora sp. WMMB762 TaxID=3404120 RepID=UPI003B94DC0D